MVEESEIVELETGVDAAIVEEPLTFKTALQKVLQASLFHDGLARGLREAVKALDTRQAHLCVLADSCDEPAYKKLITALCNEKDIPMVTVENSKELGQWAGLCKIDAEGQPRKVVGCSCVVIKSWGQETPARQMVLAEIKK